MYLDTAAYKSLTKIYRNIETFFFILTEFSKKQVKSFDYSGDIRKKYMDSMQSEHKEYLCPLEKFTVSKDDIDFLKAT
ncbi:hypothetical protein HZS_5380 [Henneguya salminicola]|nr:hypothetical protein HZS_5380 [Henneguya salminicola]